MIYSRIHPPLFFTKNNTEDPRVLPPKASDSLLLQHAKTQITSIQNNALFDTCTKCQASLEVAKFLALAAPDQGPELAVFVCNAFSLSSTCEATYEGTPLGAMVTQVLASADVGGFDGQVRAFIFSMLFEKPYMYLLKSIFWIVWYK